MIDFQPARRTPGGNPEGQVRVIPLCGPDQGYDTALVAFYVEMLQLEVAGHFVAAVPRAAVIVAVHRDSASRELQVAVRSEKIVHDFLLLGARQSQKRVPVEFIESGSPCLEGSALRRSVDRDYIIGYRLI